MAKHLRCLWLLTLLLGSNAHAWYCTIQPSTSGYLVDYSHVQCHDISATTAIQNYWCPYNRQDPICGIGIEPIVPACIDRTEVQSISCPVHYSGVINQTRTFYCQSNTYSAWTTSSNNCSPDPPTCHTTTEQRQVACQSGYTGSITEQRTSSCQDPYGQPIFGAWVETQNSCVKSITNVTNPVSPVSPISPTVTVTPAPAEQPVQQPLQPTATENVMPSITQEVKTETKTEVKQEVKQEVKTEEKQTEQPKAPDVPKGKELVNGFGVVMSLELINAPIKFQQQQLEIALEYSQELPDGIRGNQEFIAEIISQSGAINLFDIGSKRWHDLYSNYEVQPDY